MKGTAVSRTPQILNILLAEDDPDDRAFFEEAIAELELPVHLNIVRDGTQLMEYLHNKKNKLPQALFLDLDMPRKNGFACLMEIKLTPRLQKIPVLICSTLFDQDMLNLVYKDAAHFFIRKPSEFSQLKKVLLQALTLVAQKKLALPGKDNFVLTGEPK